MADPEWSIADPDHPMTRMMNSLIDGHRVLCSEAGISPWDFCVMLANVQGLILGDSKDMPDDTCRYRIHALGEISMMRMEEIRTKGSA